MAPPGAASSTAATTGAESSPGARKPSSLRDALKAVNKHIGGPVTPSDSASEEDYDALQDASSSTLLLRRRRDAAGNLTAAADGGRHGATQAVKLLTSTVNGSKSMLRATSNLSESPSNGTETPPVLAVDSKELREVLRKGLRRARESGNGGDGAKKRRGKFSDLVFTRQFSTFDRHHEHAANSPFHGFYTLFWLAVGLFMLKIAAENWRMTGSPLGTNEIMQGMFRSDVVVMLALDGVMCGLTGVSWILQKLVFKNYIDWDTTGWVLQNLWQTAFIGGVIEVTLWRDWPWTHTVFFVLHGLVMLMKQHSYAFYNGYLSTVHKERTGLLQLLRKLEDVSPAASPTSSTAPPLSSLSTAHLGGPPSAAKMKERRQSMSAGAGPDGTDLDRIASAVEAGEPLDLDQCRAFERIIQWEVDALSDELRGKALAPERAYPHNLTLANHYEYIVLPTVVYELEYPRSESISWAYVAEKFAAMVGIILVMIMLSQAFIYPIVMRTLAMKESGMPLAQRFQEFPWMLSDLIFPFMMEYLLAWYLIWETILNILAELTYFADRSFYDAWWNSVSWDQFARDWNRPVHNFLLRHVYHSSISTMRINKVQATLVTFFLSACVHELVMWCLFKKLRGYLLFLQMCQLPLVSLSRSRWLRGQETLGNLIFWLGIFTGPSLLCSLYLIL